MKVARVKGLSVVVAGIQRALIKSLEGGHIFNSKQTPDRMRLLTNVKTVLVHVHA